jgi:hypothetical protein
MLADRKLFDRIGRTILRRPTPYSGLWMPRTDSESKTVEMNCTICYKKRSAHGTSLPPDATNDVQAAFRGDAACICQQDRRERLHG